MDVAIVVVVDEAVPVVTALIHETEGIVTPAPVAAHTSGILARTANILPVFVRMYTPLGVLMIKICSPALILFEVTPDSVVVTEPGNMISERMFQTHY